MPDVSLNQDQNQSPEAGPQLPWPTSLTGLTHLSSSNPLSDSPSGKPLIRHDIYKNVFPEESKPVRPLLYIFLGFLIFISLLLLSFTLIFFAIAYDFLDIDNPTLDQTITRVVKSLPYMP